MEYLDHLQSIAHDPTWTAAVLVSVAVLILSYVYFRSEDISPVPFTVQPPPQVYSDYEWDLSLCASVPEVQNDGLIYPRCPADGRPLSSTPITPATPADIDLAISKAAAAQKIWSQTTFRQRRKLLNTLLQFVVENQEHLVTAACLDSGKTRIDACFGEILVTVEKLQWTLKHGEAALSPSGRPTNLLMCYKKNSVVYEPLGVVAACFSWNYPFHSWISCVISSLFSGNAIILKPSEQTCWSSIYFLDIVRTALRVCGHEDCTDVVQNVVCLPDTADYLTSHPGLSHITFIGSREVAYKVCASAAKALTPVCVELGGKDPAIILDDKATIRDIDNIVSIIMRGTFQSAGQNCIGIERIIALPGIHDLLVRKLEEKIKPIRLGSITYPVQAKDTKHSIDMGSMISPRSFSRLSSLIHAAIAQGAILHTGGEPYTHPQFPHGHYFQPTLLSNINAHNMPIAQTELFAPVALVIRATSLDDAISIANSTSYGLGASVFGHDAPSLARLKRSLQAGMVAVNDFGAFYAVSLPFGGVKGSGYGRFSGAEGLQGLSNVKSICEDAGWARLLGVRTQIPPVLQYPVNGTSGWKACKGIIRTGYGIGVLEKVKGVKELLGGLIG